MKVCGIFELWGDSQLEEVSVVPSSAEGYKEFFAANVSNSSLEISTVWFEGRATAKPVTADFVDIGLVTDRAFAAYRKCP